MLYRKWTVASYAQWLKILRPRPRYLLVKSRQHKTMFVSTGNNHAKNHYLQHQNSKFFTEETKLTVTARDYS